MDNETEVILEQMEGTRASLAEKLETLENQVVGTIQEATSTVSETVQQVKDAVTDTVETVKDTVEGTVESVKDSMHDTVESVKETFDVRRQVQNHPWLMFGGSFVAGYVASRLMRRYLPRGSFGMPSWQNMASAMRQFPAQESFTSAPSSYEEMGRGVAAQAYDRAGEREPDRAPPPEPQQQKPGWLDSLTSMLGPELGKLKGLAIGASLGIVRDMITQSAPPELGSQLADMVNGVTTRLGGEVIQGPVLDKFTGDRSGHPRDRGPGGQEPEATSQHDYRTAYNH